MDNLPNNFIRPPGSSAKRSGSPRPAPFSASEFSREAIEQESQAYVLHIEQSATQPESNEEPESVGVAPGTQISESVVADDRLRNSRKPARNQRTTPGQKRSPLPKPLPADKANIRLEIAADIRKDMIKIKHKVGITHGIEVSYAAYFMFLHERCRAESGTPAFLTDLAHFVEQRKA